MKFLFVIPRMGGGGAERVVSLVSNYLAKNGNNVTVLTLVSGESFYELDTSVHFESIGITINRKSKMHRTFSQVLFLPKSIVTLYKKLKTENYDVVISMLTECDILVGLCKFAGLQFRHVCSERNDPTRRKGIYFALLKAIYKHAALFICQSKKVYDYYKDVPASIKTVIPNPVDGTSFPECPKTKSKRVVAIGRLNEQKNFSLLIESFANLGKELDEFKLDIYGEGPEHAKLQKLIDKLGLEKRVTLRGAQKDVVQLIADAELFVMSSDYEGFPNALLEAMAIGLPVISTDFPTGVARDLIGNENGIVVPVKDENALTEAMRFVLLNNDVRIRMGIKNREMCKKYYTEKIMQKWENEIKTITES